MKIHILPLLALLPLTACTPTPSPSQPTLQATYNNIPNAQKTNTPLKGTITANTHGHKISATLTWRKYLPSLDANIKTWHGDMASPPPLYVADSLTILSDGIPVNIPQNKFRSLASKWPPNTPAEQMQLVTKGKTTSLIIMLGDGGESWAAVYTIDPKSKTLLSTQIEDGPSIQNQIL